MRGCEGRLRSRLSAKLHSIPPPQAETLSLPAGCCRERQRASQPSSKRSRLHLFESAALIGTKTLTDKILGAISFHHRV
jgi:hypothetical protein